MTERVLCVVAHPDDEVLACGGALAKHSGAGDEVRILMLADGVSSREGWTRGEFNARLASASRASDILGANGEFLGLPDQKLDTLPQIQINRVIEKVLREFKPTMVYTHWRNDLNTDHRIVCGAVLTACRPVPGSSVRRILMGEVPSSTEWSGRPFTPNYFVDVSETIAAKMAALACYETELRESVHPRSIASVMGLAQWRGASVGVAHAEAFVLARGIA